MRELAAEPFVTNWLRANEDLVRDRVKAGLASAELARLEQLQVGPAASGRILACP